MIERTAPNTKKVLVVDFDPDYLKLLVQWLSREGFQVITAMDGLSGLERYKKERPDLVVLEAMLPRLHGFELCSKIATDGESRTPVIITTNVYKDAAYRTEAMRNFGAAAYFEKPPDRIQFLAQVRRSLKLDEPEEAPAPAAGRAAADPLASLESGNGRKTAAAAAPAARPRPSENAIDDLLNDALAEFGLKSDKAPAAKPAAAPVPVVPPRPGRFPSIGEATKPDVPRRPKETQAPGADGQRTASGSPAAVPASPERVEDLLRTPVKTTPARMPGVRPGPIDTRPRPVDHAAPAAVPATSSRPALETRPIPPAPEPWPAAKEAAADAAPIPIFGSPTFQDYISPDRKPFPVKAVAAAAGVVLIGALAFLFLRPGKDAGNNLPIGDQAYVQTESTAVPAPDPAEEPPDEAAEAEDTGAAAAAATNPPLTKKIVQPQYKQTPPSPAPSPELKPVVPAAAQGPEIKLATPAATSQVGATAAESEAGRSGGATETRGAGAQAPPERAAATADTAARPEAPAPAPPKAKAGDLVALESVDAQPVTLQRTQPAYPSRAFQAGREGSVTVNALISERGDVMQVVYLRGDTELGFDKAAMAAVMKWKFQPALKDGVPVKVWKPLTLIFRKN